MNTLLSQRNYNVLCFKTAIPPRARPALSTRQIPMWRGALPFSMMRRKNPAKIPRKGAMGVNTQITAASRTSVSHPYQWACMDNSTWRKIIASSKKHICWNPSASTVFRGTEPVRDLSVAYAHHYDPAGQRSMVQHHESAALLAVFAMYGCHHLRIRLFCNPFYRSSRFCEKERITSHERQNRS